MHITFQLYDLLRLDSTVVIYILINISSPKLTKYFKILKHRVHEYASGLTSTPKAELFCSCVTIKSKYVNYKVKILSFWVKNWLS